ncbi:regulator of G-protein signaling loco isoform X2 [Bacillus rossius redtenbacheri]|uniref:regulator of G-protein signaling loco isoform X2 n=1 Tax=Bacillus rossius redtenbacheri TaxID=93214 RepID=UPI002FDCDDBC
MHPVRRRKKRPNYGIRTVEVSRGSNGFGFTISGQQPCILSCIVAGSPAERAGLRPGDCLVSVNSQSVSKVPHDDVVRLIGASSSALRLQIADNYYSDSSEDDAPAARAKPRCLHRLRVHAQQGRAAKVVRDLRTGAMFEEPPCEDSPAPSPPPPRPAPVLAPSPAPAPVPEHRALVGYLGTIEMPRELQPGSRLQVVRGCIRRLRAEKRAHTLVLMSVRSRSLLLSNCHGAVLAEYPAERVAFCGPGLDDERRFFGLVTMAVPHADEAPSSSCHVFAVEPSLHGAHATHAFKAEAFKLRCSLDPVHGSCREFPGRADEPVAAVRRLYDDQPPLAHSPRPSSTPTTASSNSDSGIGFRDDCGNQSDGILVVDLQERRPHVLAENPAGRLTVRAMPDPVVSSRSRSPLCGSSSDGPCGGSSQDALLSYKLSPKVFGVARPVTHSLEDLPGGGTSHVHQWGSLQELRSFENTPQAQHTDQHQPRAAGEDDASNRQPTDGGVAGWASSLERLLDDPAGLHTFAEFLKKEFSHENIYFWVACERYRGLNDPLMRKKVAHQIFDQHMCLGALEPVNVDSHARQETQEGLDEAAPSLFLQAQKQIFNLMKFDSYPRFIKSELYKEVLMRDLSGEVLPYRGLDLALEAIDAPEPSRPTHKLKKSRSDAEDRRRKSLLPWHRRNRSQSKDRGDWENGVQDADVASMRSDFTSSRSSLASWDRALRGSFSRQSLSSSSGECALCRVCLPDGATTVVQIRPRETVCNLVLRQLDKRGLRFSAFDVFYAPSHQLVGLDEDSSVLARCEVQVERRVVFRLDLPNRKTVGVKARPDKALACVLRPILHKYNYRLQCVTLCLMSESEVVEMETPASAVDNKRLQVLTRNTDGMKGKATPSLEEIANRVFEEVLQGKCDSLPSDRGSDDWGSEHSYGLFGRAGAHGSASATSTASCQETRTKSKKNPVGSKLGLQPPLITKLKVGVKLQGRSDSDELCKGLERAQRSRLEDQRGTEINFELPDFLKDKENAPQGKKLRKAVCMEEARRRDSDPPPPLPPKPKHLPSPAPWQPQPRGVFRAPAEITNSGRLAGSRRAVYLEEPSSSFV